MKKPILGTDQKNKNLELDLDRLISTRLLISAMSGAGKSWLLRRILEQTYGLIPQIVIDPEGEFYTLREQFDYVIARPNGEGDCPAEVRSAKMLAHTLLELGVSAIIDIQEMRPMERTEFVKEFLEGLINSPRKLWHPTLVVLDEAAMFAPEDGRSIATESVMALATLGRKRGFAALFAIQRPAMFNKTAAAMCANMIFGRQVLDVDLERTAKALGFKKERQDEIRQLDDGDFFCFGSAISREVTRFHSGPVKTSHPQPGNAAPPVAPPRGKIVKALARLKEIPEEHRKEEQTIASMQVELGKLKTELANAERVTVVSSPVRLPPTKEEIDKIERGAVSKFFASHVKPQIDIILRNSDRLRDEMTRQFKEWGGDLEAIHHANENIFEKLKEQAKIPEGGYYVVSAITPGTSVTLASELEGPKKTTQFKNPGDVKIKALARKILTALAQYPEGLEKERLAALVMRPIAGHFTNELGRMRTLGFVSPATEIPRIMQSGLKALGDYEPLPTGEALRKHWLSKFSGMRLKILKALFEGYDFESSEGLARFLGVAPKGHFTNELGALRTLGIVTPAGTKVAASKSLMEDL